MPMGSYDIVFPLLVAGRLLVSLSGISQLLAKDQLLSSPLTSYASLQEGVYLYNNGIDPYSGGVFRHPPLYLSLFATILPKSGIYPSIIWTVCDAVGAWSLVQIWHTRQHVKQSSRDLLVAAFYLLNPYIFFPALALSTSTIESALALITIMFACKGKSSATLLSLAFLLHISLSSIVLFVPVLLLLIADPTSHLVSPRAFASSFKKTIVHVVEFGVYSTTLVVASIITTGGTSWVYQTWGATLTLPDLTPNPGLWWYFFTEMFDYFRPFFLMVFSVHLIIYVVPICIKFQYDVLYACFLVIGVLATFKAYPTLSDPGLFLSMMSIFPEVYPYLRHPLVTALLHLHASLLMPLFHHLWLTQGTGNANFFYASTLVFACANGAALVDCLYAGLRIAIGEDKEGWVVVQE